MLYGSRRITLLSGRKIWIDPGSCGYEIEAKELTPEEIDRISDNYFRDKLKSGLSQIIVTHYPPDNDTYEEPDAMERAFDIDCSWGPVYYEDYYNV